MSRRTTAVLGACVLTLGLTSGAALAGRPSQDLVVTGYAEDGTGAAVIAREAHALTTVGVDGVTLRESGASFHGVSSGVRSLERAAHRQGLRAELLVSNYDSRTGDFSPEIGARLLRDAGHRAAVADALARVVRTQGWDGITVDLESLSAGDGPGLVRFVQLLAVALPGDASVSVDLMSATTASGYRYNGYQLAALARSADVLALMAYDRHGPSWSRPGPVGPLGWQRASLRALLSQVPADQVDLGVAGYGYTWPAAPHRHDGRTVTDARARQLVERDGATARWVGAKGEWTATLHDGTILWWSDARSWLRRVEVAQRAGLHGLALWRLGSADPLP